MQTLHCRPHSLHSADRRIGKRTLLFLLQFIKISSWRLNLDRLSLIWNCFVCANWQTIWFEAARLKRKGSWWVYNMDLIHWIKMCVESTQSKKNSNCFQLKTQFLWEVINSISITASLLQPSDELFQKNSLAHINSCRECSIASKFVNHKNHIIWSIWLPYIWWIIWFTWQLWDESVLLSYFRARPIVRWTIENGEQKQWTLNLVPIKQSHTARGMSNFKSDHIVSVYSLNIIQWTLFTMPLFIVFLWRYTSAVRSESSNSIEASIVGNRCAKTISKIASLLSLSYPAFYIRL